MPILSRGILSIYKLAISTPDKYRRLCHNINGDIRISLKTEVSDYLVRLPPLLEREEEVLDERILAPDECIIPADRLLLDEERTAGAEVRVVLLDERTVLVVALDAGRTVVVEERTAVLVVRVGVVLVDAERRFVVELFVRVGTVTDVLGVVVRVAVDTDPRAERVAVVLF